MGNRLRENESQKESTLFSFWVAPTVGDRYFLVGFSKPFVDPRFTMSPGYEPLMIFVFYEF